MIRSTQIAALLIALSMSGCMGVPEVAGDPAESSFGGGFAKADGTYELCDLRKVLELVNRSDMDRDGLLEVLDGLSTRGRVVDNILAHRDGPDGVLGTGDDDLFDDLDELDAIPYVGPVTLDRLIVAAAGECIVDLDSRPFIDATTFAGRTGGGWTRDNVELEATYTVTNVTGARLREALHSTDSRGRTMFERIRKNRDLEAFTYGYDLSEMPWDRGSHRLRERMPYIMLTIESGRFEPDADTGVRELSLGTDIMDDVYFDTRGFDLVHHDLLLRGRARWDTPTEIRRLLIAAKRGSEVDEEGLKRAAKVDVRRDRPSAAQIASLVFDVQRTVDWGGSDVAVEPIRTIYEQLRDASALPDIDGHAEVLLLDPIAHLRSTRSRLHFNEVRVSTIEALHRLGAERITFAVAFADERIADGDVTGSDLALIQQLAADGRAILDRSALVERANAELAAAGLPAGFDATTLPAPASFPRPTSAEDIATYRVIAEAISDVHHDYSDLLDDCDRILSRADDRSWDDYADYFVAWMRSQDQTLGRNQIIDPYLERFEAMDIATERPAFNTWAAAQRDDGDDDFEGFVEVDAAGWARVEQALTLEMLKIHQRQIEAAG
ncbi:MAG TPA: hypothetical protein ENK57_03665, partial [Polyangiaceae bacterium]|nr:hypothetical protein [Polyangiaceae bacterium]